jgi:hypothetical protein
VTATAKPTATAPPSSTSKLFFPTP